MIGTTNAMGGGGAGSDDCTLVKANVPKGLVAITADSDDEAVEGTFDATSTAGDGNVMEGVTYTKYNTTSKRFEKRNGTLKKNGSMNASLNCGQSKAIPAGYTDGGTIVANSLASQTPGTATAGNIITGKTAVVNGVAITGNMPERGAYNGNGNSQGNNAASQFFYVNIPSGHYNENAQVRIPWANVRSWIGLTPDKIRKNVPIMGITGSWEGYISSPFIIYNMTVSTGQNWPNSQNMGMSQTYSNFNDNNMESFRQLGADSKSLYTSWEWGSSKVSPETGTIIGRTNQTYNLTAYNFLKCVINLSVRASGATCYIGVSTNSNLTNTNFDSIVSVSVDGGTYNSDSANPTLISNISALKGDYFIYFAVKCNRRNPGTSYGNMSCQEIQLTTV